MREMKGTMREGMGSIDHRRTRTHRFGRTACLLPANREVTSALSRMAPRFSAVGCRIRLIAG